MHKLTCSEIEEWLNKHHDFFQEYFLKNADLLLVNKWLLSKGFHTVNEYLVNDYTSRKPSLICSAATENANTTTTTNNNSVDHQSRDVDLLVNGSSAASEPTEGVDDQQQLQKRNNSKKCLRHDFAKNKSKSFVRMQEIGTNGFNKEFASIAASTRRSSLKDMRKYTSLPPNSLHMLSLLIESKVHLPRCSLRQSVAAKKEILRAQGDNEFFLSAVREIANELDLKSLSQKVVDNLSVLLDADGASLFLVEGPKNKRRLVSKVFDVYSGVSKFLLSGGYSSTDNEVQVPWGVGVVGFVAETSEVVNLQVATEDPRFDDEVDKITGYHTDSLLCLPVKNTFDEVIAVAQVVNKNPNKDGGHFTFEDEKIFKMYLQFVGIALANAQVIESSREEYERNRNLLEVVHDVFEEQTSLQEVIVKIMQRAKKLLKCEKAAVLLTDENSEVTKFAKLFELNSETDGKRKDGEEQSPNSTLTVYLSHIAEHVAKTGAILNAENYFTGTQEEPVLKSLLAMPIRDKNYQIIGVASIMNKLNGTAFDENDEHLFEAFTIFCGLGIHNTLMYAEVEKAVARQKVSIEVLSYHVSASNQEVERFLAMELPRVDELNLYSLTFDDFSLNEDEMLLATITMFTELGLINKFGIDKVTLYRFLLTVKRNYRDVPYHNWRHAFNVAQIMFAVLMGCEIKSTFTDVEVLGMFVGCLCHDLDHRGTNNAFQQKAGSALVLLYGNTNTMEHHHFNQAIMILSTENLNIFSCLSAENYAAVMKVLKRCILATDLCIYFQSRPTFFSLIDSEKYSWDVDEHRELLRNMLMTASDIAASCKPWSIQYRVAKLVTDEFLTQGDKERNELKIQPQALMDRERQHELPMLQLHWIADICLPLYQALGKMNPKLNVMAEGAIKNMNQWKLMSETNAE